uniref:Sedoheptulose 1,7-bisphosphatase n=1 Tax=Talaromyces marneffei PM1 TaxID=1077442 RepID=A0A093UWT8_TALMA
MSNLDSMTPRVFLARHGTVKLIDPTRIARIWVSPRKRAQQTFRLLFDVDGRDDYGNLVEVSEDIAEWDYGDYEGLRVGEVRAAGN